LQGLLTHNNKLKGFYVKNALLKSSAHFRKFFLVKLQKNINLAAEIFIGPLLHIVAEFSASWQHCLLIFKVFFPYGQHTINVAIVKTWAESWRDMALYGSGSTRNDVAHYGAGSATILFKF
jgi:hypothetical protein